MCCSYAGQHAAQNKLDPRFYSIQLLFHYLSTSVLHFSVSRQNSHPYGFQLACYKHRIRTMVTLLCKFPYG